MAIRGFILTIGLVLAVTNSALADGVFMVVKGNIKVEGADKKVVPAKVGMKVKEGDSVIAGKDARAKIVMQDNNVFNISPESKMKIEKYVNDGAKKDVSLNLLYGKVRSTVNQKYEGENKFRIKTPSAVAGVRGTDFLSNFSRETRTSQFVTFEGRVEVGAAVGANGQIVNPVSVNPGQMTVASAGGAPSAPTAVPAAELAGMSNDSKTDNANDRQPANGGGNGGENNKDGDKKDKDNNGRNDSAKNDGPNSENGQGQGETRDPAGLGTDPNGPDGNGETTFSPSSDEVFGDLGDNGPGEFGDKPVDVGCSMCFIPDGGLDVPDIPQLPDGALQQRTYLLIQVNY